MDGVRSIIKKLLKCLKAGKNIGKPLVIMDDNDNNKSLYDSYFF
jgi:hypothetical protein